VSFGQSVRSVLGKNYATFSGRATRSEYWWFILFYSLCMIVLFIPVILPPALTADGEEPSRGLTALGLVGLLLFFGFFLATVVPSIAVTVRRLHDAGFSGWMYLLGFIPYVGGFIILVLACLGSKPDNKWGPNPKAATTYTAGLALPPPGWYPNPSGQPGMRWWDGYTWTGHVS
jgi:uncharacterized membrane protein YhaH (DUF805 family)